MGSHCNASVLFRNWIILTLTSFIRYRSKAVSFSSRISQKSYSTTSNITLKHSFCKDVFLYGNQNTANIFVEFNHQFLNIFTRIIVLLLFHSMLLNFVISSISNAVNPLFMESFIILWFTAVVRNIMNVKSIFSET